MTSAIRRGTLVLTLCAGCGLPPPPDTQRPTGSTSLTQPAVAVRRDEEGTLWIRVADGRGGSGEVRVFDADGQFNREAATLSSIATDPREDRAFVAQSFPTGTLAELEAARPYRSGDPMSVKALLALEPDGTVRTVLRFNDESSPALAFTDDALLVMTCSHVGSGLGHIRRYDRAGRTLHREARVNDCATPGYWWQTPQWIALRDVGSERVTFVDARTLAATTLRHAEYPTLDLPMHQRDAALRVVFEDLPSFDGDAPLRVELFELAGVSPERVPMLTPARTWRLMTRGLPAFTRFSHGVTPDDRRLLVPDAQRVRALDLTTGAETVVLGAYAGTEFAGFSPDGSALFGAQVVNTQSGSVLLHRLSFDGTNVWALPRTLPGIPRIAHVPSAAHALLVAGARPVELWRIALARPEAERLMTFGETPPVFAVSDARGGEAWIAHEGLVRLSVTSLEQTRAAIEWVPTQVAVGAGGGFVWVDRPRRNALVRLRSDTAMPEREYVLPRPSPPRR